MKASQLILKLAFVGVLVCVLLSRASLASCQTQYYECNSGMSSCVQLAQQWMGQCVGNCPHQGTDENFCYGFANCSCNNLTCTNGYTCYADSECFDAPSSGPDCIQNCSSQMTDLMDACYSEYCTAE